MTSSPFPRVSICIKQKLELPEDALVSTLKRVYQLLCDRGHSIILEPRAATYFPEFKGPRVPLEDLGQHGDLVIVIGGDGSLLHTARSIVASQVPIVGINRGRLGFLTDISPDEIDSKLLSVLEGHYQEESRFLLAATLMREGECIAQAIGLNDVVLYSGGLARMLEFDVFVNQQFLFRQRADGLISATPTGSTAYALSGGGPILYPTLNAILLLPMMAHTLTSRPLVINDSSRIELRLAPQCETPPKLSVDGQIHWDLLPLDTILIQKHQHDLRLIHPKTHDYFSVLRQKLGWSTDLSSDRWSSAP